MRVIQIRVRLFAALREEIGKEVMEFEVPHGASCQEVFEYLESQFAFLTPLLERSLVAVNGFYAAKDALLSRGDEVVLLPPVSGG